MVLPLGSLQKGEKERDYRRCEKEGSDDLGMFKWSVREPSKSRNYNNSYRKST
jgi:hypothetical protein